MPRVSNIKKALAAWKSKKREPPIKVRAEELHRMARGILLKEASP